MLNNYMPKLKSIYDRGFAHIFSSSLINKAMNFIGNVIVVRNLTKSQYGSFGYADSIMAFALVFCGFGISSGILQFCSERRPDNEKNAFTVFGIKYGFWTSFLLSLICAGYALFGDLQIESSKNVLLFYSFYPITYFFFDYLCVLFRTKKNNRRFALIKNINSVIYVVLAASLTYYINEYGIITGLYVSTIASSLVGIYYIRKEKAAVKEYNLSQGQKKSIIKFSALSFTARIMANLLIFLDIFLIGTIMGNPNVLALYKIATVIPLALMFVPDSIIMFVYPFVAENKNNFQWLKENCIKLMKYSLVLNGIISLCLIAGAPFIIYILWGTQYMDAVTPFRILAINYFLSATFRFNLINLLTAMGKIKQVFIINTVSGIANIGLDIVLIKYLGSIGAAYATVMVVILSSTLLAYVMINNMKNIRKNNDLMEV